MKTQNNYSGIIEPEDFNTYEPNKNRIGNQKSADELMEDTKMGLTLEELRELRKVSNTDGRPSPDLTDKKWQEEFRLRRLFVQPTEAKKFGGRHARMVKAGEIDGDLSPTSTEFTNYRQYSCFINDILDNIRRNQVDYCYYIYQILDLLPFHRDELRTRYCDGYWEVWLER